MIGLVPIIIIAVISIASAIFFTPLGNPLFDSLPSDSEQTQTEGDALDMEGKFEAGFSAIDELVQGSLQETDIESLDLPSNPTNEELSNLGESAVDVGRSSFNLYFSFKNLVEDMIYFLSPVAIVGWIIAVVAFVVAIMFFLGVGKHLIKHILRFLIILVGIMIFFIAFGDKIQF